MRYMAEGIHLLLKVFAIIGAVLAVLPLLFLVSGAFMGETELGQLLFSGTDGGAGYTAWHMIPLYPTFQNIVELLFDTPEYYVLFWNSVKIVGVVIAGQLVFAVPAAWGLSRSGSRWAKADIWPVYVLHDTSISGDDAVTVHSAKQSQHDKYPLGYHFATDVLNISDIHYVQCL